MLSFSLTSAPRTMRSGPAARSRESPKRLGLSSPDWRRSVCRPSSATGLDSAHDCVARKLIYFESGSARRQCHYDVCIPCAVQSKCFVKLQVSGSQIDPRRVDAEKHPGQIAEFGAAL